MTKTTIEALRGLAGEISTFAGGLFFTADLQRAKGFSDSLREIADALGRTKGEVPVVAHRWHQPNGAGVTVWHDGPAIGPPDQTARNEALGYRLENAYAYAPPQPEAQAVAWQTRYPGEHWNDCRRDWYEAVKKERPEDARELFDRPHPTTPDVGVEDWKARALAAEADIERMTDAFNRENGPTFMGEPVLPPEKMVELDSGVRVPIWLLDHARRIELYMKSKLPGPWRIGGIQSHDYASIPPAEPSSEGVTDEMVARAFNWAEDALERAGHSPNGPEMMAFYEARAALATKPAKGGEE